MQMLSAPAWTTLVEDKIIVSIFYRVLYVVYFDQHFGAAHHQMLVEIVIFSIFSAKKLKKALKKSRNLQQIFAKDTFFKFTPKRWSTVLCMVYFMCSIK